MIWLALTVVLLKHLVSVYSALEHPLLMLMSLDGMRYDFISEEKTPHIWSLAKNGVYALNGVKPQVTTVTASNHHCMATGLYQESHGIIDNVFYDPVFKEKFDVWGLTGWGAAYKSSKLSKWYTGEPIWQTNMKLSGRLSGTYYWPAGDANINNIKPKNKYKVWSDYSDDYKTWTVEIDELLNWFVSKENPVNFVLYYNAEPDMREHSNDIYGSEVGEIIRQVDDLIGYLVEKCKQFNIFHRLNLIITSDHGFVNIPDEFTGFSDLFEYLDRKRVRENSNSYFAIDGKESTTEEIYKNLSKAVADGVNIKVWRKNEFPDKYHWKNNRRIGDVIAFYNIESDANDSKRPRSGRNRGTHFHFLNDDKRMNVLFVAHGPVFKKGFVLERDDIENVDYYPLMCHILGVIPAPNNGSFDRLASILDNSSAKFTDENTRYDKNSSSVNSSKNKTFLVIALIGTVACIFLVYMCIRFDIRRKSLKVHRNRRRNPFLSFYHMICDRSLKGTNNFNDKRFASDGKPFLDDCNDIVIDNDVDDEL